MSARTSLAILAVAALSGGCSTGPDPVASAAGSSVPEVESTVPLTTTTSSGSAGCDSSGPTAGRSVVTIESGDIERSYVRYVPKQSSHDDPAPLVIDFPAYSPASLEEAFSGFTTADAGVDSFADEVGAVVVTPEPVNGEGSLLTWNYVGTPGWTDDQEYVADVLDDVAASTCVDTDRVLATGFAVGAVFASIVACQQPERITVLATVSGLFSPPDCDPGEPIPVISFHGTGDRFIPFDGGVGSGAAGLGLSAATTSGLLFMGARPGALESASAWAAHDGCDTDATMGRTSSDVGVGVSLRVWSACDGGAEVQLYEIDGGEHTWPGSTGMADYEGLLGPVSDEVMATEVIWDFFAAHW